MNNTHNGSCLCGDIQFTFSGTPFSFSLCHCTMCQKFGGSAFGAYIGIKKETFSYKQGKSLVKTYASSEWASRAFCQQCGSSLMYIYHNMPDCLFVSAGLLDTKFETKPSKHIFTKDKCPWFEITDELPQIEKY